MPPVPTSKAAPAPTLKPAKDDLQKDRTGYPIPRHVQELWDRSEQVQQSCLTPLSTIQGILKRAEETGDKAFIGVSLTSALGKLDEAYAFIKEAKPFAVCATCQGQVVETCCTCHGKGFVSEFFWDRCVPEETKQIRFKTRK